MKLIILIFIGCSAILFPCKSQTLSPSGQQYQSCLINDIDTSKLKRPKEWKTPDWRTESLWGKQAIIDEAWSNVMQHIKRCGSETAIGEILSKTGDRCYNYDEFDYYWYWKIDYEKDVTNNLILVFDKPTYSQIQFNAGALGASVVYDTSYTHWAEKGYIHMNFNKIEYKIFNNLDFCCTDFCIAKFMQMAIYEGNKTEIYYINIFIPPLVFEQKHLFMPTESQPFAESPVEALEYILFHELGHVETSIRNNSIFFSKMPKMGNDERTCDSFASSLWRCH